MSGNSEPSAATPEKSLSLSHTRILRAMGLVVFSGAILGFIFSGTQFGIGFLIGGGLAFLNYFWLKRALKNVFENAGDRPGFLTGSYFLRYAGLGLAIWIVYLSGIVSMIAVLLGLAAFALAIVIEGLIIMFLSVSKRKEF